MRYDPQQLINSLKTAGALPGGGWWRALGTSSELEARTLVSTWMKDAGLTVRTDAAANLFGRVDGDRDQGVIVTGSHLDTVKAGGAYDGAAGVVASLVAVTDLLVERGKPKRPVEVVVTAEEEGSRFGRGFVGSMGMVGRLEADDLSSTDPDGVTVSDGLAAAGGDPTRLAAAKRKDIAAYIELHIEQGTILEGQGAQLGIVTVVTGLSQRMVTIRGRADHAGTTPHDRRQDALVAAARIICGLAGVAQGISSQSRATAGWISARPGAFNVVPGQVEFTLDLRDVDEDRLVTLEREVSRLVNDAARPLAASIEQRGRQLPVSLDPELSDLAAACAQEVGVTAIRMPSGAGHDAQVIQGIAPACLLFVPCREGRSHCPEEYCDTGDLVAGISVMKCMLARLAW